MAGTQRVRIVNKKYYAPFDNSDNECCWQIDVLGGDIERILERYSTDLDALYEDWGASFCWVNRQGIHHAITARCVDAESASFEVEYFAFREGFRIFGIPIWNFRVDADDPKSDFGALIPELERLSDSDAGA